MMELVAVALRFTDASPTVDPLTGEVDTSPRTSGLSAADAGALEHGLRVAETFGLRCVAVGLGSAVIEPMLRDALATGVDEVLRVAGPDPAETVAEDGSGEACAIAAAIRDRYGMPDLVLCGDRSADRGTGATPAFLAAELGAVQALGLVELSYAGAGLTGLRRLDGGRRERLAIPAPAVCSLEPTEIRLRRAPLPATLRARRAEVPVAEVGVRPSPVRVAASRPYRPRARILGAPREATAHQRVLELTGALVERDPPTVSTPPDAAAAADELLTYLRDRGYLSL
jgi:electron transfer flavoprotein beta subunit